MQRPWAGVPGRDARVVTGGSSPQPDGGTAADPVAPARLGLPLDEPMYAAAARLLGYPPSLLDHPRACVEERGHAPGHIMADLVAGAVGGGGGAAALVRRVERVAGAPGAALDQGQADAAGRPPASASCWWSPGGLGPCMTGGIWTPNRPSPGGWSRSDGGRPLRARICSPTSPAGRAARGLAGGARRGARPAAYTVFDCQGALNWQAH
jgi:hypothetical protein